MPRRPPSSQNSPVLEVGDFSDLAAVLSMNNRAVPAVSHLAQPDLAHLFSQAERLLVARDRAHLVGFTLLMTGPGRDYDSPNYDWFSARYDSFLYVDRIVVADSHRGAGLGKLMYRQAIDLGLGRFPVLCAEVNIKPRNQPSLDFHERMGFDPVGEQDTDLGEKRVVMLARPLEPTSSDGEPGGVMRSNTTRSAEVPTAPSSAHDGSDGGV